jgi:signal transduction histidine kinase/ligand-binding sensor domain-containing protein
LKNHQNNFVPFVIFMVLSALLAGTVSLASQSAPSESTPGEEKAPSIQDESLQNEERLLPASLNLHQWGAVTLFHGLPSNHVRAIVQDMDGVLWFGTNGGLARYDGRRTQKVVAEGLPAGNVRSIKLDGNGGFWIGTDSGAGRLLGEKFSLISETAGYSISAIITPEPGKVVIASDQGLIFKCSTDSDNSVKVQTIGPGNSPLLLSSNKAPLPLTSLAVLKGTLLVGSHGRGLLTVNDNQVKELFAGNRQRPFFVETINPDPDGKLWFGAKTASINGGLYESDDLTRPQKIGAPTGWITSLCFDSNRDLWIGTYGQGVFLYRDSREIEHFTFENSAGGLRSNYVYSVFVDREGVVWFGTDRGVCRYDPHSPHAERISYQPDSNFARAMFRSTDGRLWCGTNRGLFVREPNTAKWLAVEELNNKAVYSIVEDSSGVEVPSGYLLIGASDGLYGGSMDLPQIPGVSRFTQISPKPVREGQAPSDSVRSICRFRGAIYIASYGRGIERLDGSTRVLVWPLNSSDPREKSVVSLHADGDDRLWIGTAEAGAFIYDGKKVSADASLVELVGTPLWNIDGRTNDGIWIATGRGLYGYWSGKLVSILQGKVRSVIASNSQKSAWCAMEGGGLYKVSIDDRAGHIFSQLNTEHGLPSDDVFTLFSEHMQSDQEVLWIGTNRGVAFYEPGKVPPVLRATRILGKRLYQPEELKTGLNLDYPQNNLVIDVAAASSRTFPEQFQYSFLLFDNSGKLIGQPKLSRESQFLVENLRPGRYQIEARAYTNELIPSEPLLLNFEVAKAPFPRTSAILLVLLLLALFVLWWGYRQNSRLTQTNMALEGANRLLADTRHQLAHETENERRRIARDLHDQTLSDLRRLLLLTDQLPVGRASNSGDTISPVFFRSELESISTEIRRICEDLSPSVLTNVGLTAAFEWALIDAVAHLPNKRKFEYEFVCADDIEERLHFDSETQIQLYRIIQEAIGNICHHAGASRVRLSVEITKENALLVSVEDDGCGFDTTKATKTGRGLNNIRSRASLIDAEVNWSPRPGGGTIFILCKYL